MAEHAPDNIPTSSTQQPSVHRWRRHILIAVIAGLVLAVSVISLVNRPLNDMERRFVGKWRNQTTGIVISPNKDRRQIVTGVVSEGKWHVRGGTLYFAETPGKKFLQMLERIFLSIPTLDSSMDVQFQDPDHLIDVLPGSNETLQGERVKPE